MSLTGRRDENTVFFKVMTTYIRALFSKTAFFESTDHEYKKALLKNIAEVNKPFTALQNIKKVIDSTFYSMHSNRKWRAVLLCWP